MESPAVASASVPSSQNDAASASVPSSQNDELITIAGGVELEVTHQDGKKETVKVRQIPISKLQQYLVSIGVGKTAETIAIYCDKPVEWVDTLSQTSALAVSKKGRELNASFLVAWLEEQKEWTKIFAPAGQAATDRPSMTTTTPSPSGSSAPQSPITTNSPPTR